MKLIHTLFMDLATLVGETILLVALVYALYLGGRRLLRFLSDKGYGFHKFVNVESLANMQSYPDFEKTLRIGGLAFGQWGLMVMRMVPKESDTSERFPAYKPITDDEYPSRQKVEASK